MMVHWKTELLLLGSSCRGTHMLTHMWSKFHRDQVENSFFQQPLVGVLRALSRRLELLPHCAPDGAAVRDNRC